MTRFPRILMAAALAASAIATSGTVLAAEKVRAVKSAAVCFCFLPADFGKSLGIFERRGIDLDITSAAGDAKVQQAMVAGSVEIGLGSGPGLGLVSKGVPAKGVAAIVDLPAGMALIAPAGSAIQSAADLKGKKIGVTTGGSLTDWLARAALESGGYTSADAQILPLGDLSSNLAAMNSGSSDAFVYGSEPAFNLQVQGKAKVVTTFDKVVPHFIAHSIFATDAFIKDKPEVLREFLAGWLETIDYMRAHRDETIAFTAATLQLEPHVAELVYDAVMPQMTTDGAYEQQALDVLNKSFVDLGMLAKEIDFASVLDTSFLPKK